MLSVNPKNINKLTRRELPHFLTVKVGEGTTMSAEQAKAEGWCVENLGRPAITDLADNHADREKGFRAFHYQGRWVRIGQKFRFRSQADATAFKLVWC